MIAVAATAIAVAVHFDCRNEKVSEYVFLLVHMLNKTAVQVTTARAATAADGESRRHKVGRRRREKVHKVELPTGGKQAQVASWKKGLQIVEKERDRGAKENLIGS